MSKITNPISVQFYQLIAPQVASILQEELGNQYAINGNESALNVKVELERTSAINQSEYSLVSVRYIDTDLTNIDQSGDGLYTSNYLIECYAAAKYNDTERGDAIVQLKLQRLTGVIRSILNSPIYKGLDLPQGVVRSKSLSSIKMAEAETDTGAMSTSYAQIRLEVVTNEISEQITPLMISEWLTTVKFGNTEDGYTWDQLAILVGGFNYPINHGIN